MGRHTRRGPRPRALVYRGPATTDDCAAAAAALLRRTRWGFDVRYVGPHESLPLDAPTLRSAALYVQPGGGDLEPAYQHLRPHTETIRSYIHDGGRYLGICLGGYLAGATPGFDLLPGDADRYIDLPDATVTAPHDAVVAVRWRGALRHLYFQDGPYFWLHPHHDLFYDTPAAVVARYRNGTIAALVVAHGGGRVAVIGPHPEADATWYPPGLVNPDGIRFDLGHDLIDTVMTP